MYELKFLQYCKSMHLSKTRNNNNVIKLIREIKKSTRNSFCRNNLLVSQQFCRNFFQVISNQLNKTMDPCDDFYSYACGGFFKTHHLGVNQSNVGGFTIVNDDNMEVLRRAMETAASNNSQVWHEVDLS